MKFTKIKNHCKSLIIMVPGAGLEPARYFYRRILSPRHKFCELYRPSIYADLRSIRLVNIVNKWCISSLKRCKNGAFDLIHLNTK